MARIFIDGFEAGQLDLWDAATFTIYSTNPIDGSYHIRGMSGAYALKNLPSAKSELWVAFRYKPESVSLGNSRIFEFRNGTTVIGSIQQSGNVIQTLRGTATVLATGSQTFGQNDVVLIEARFKPDNSAGVFQIKINGILDIDFSGDTTDGPTSIDNIRVYAYSSSFYGNFDDVIIDDAGFPGDTKIQALKPTAAGNSTQWDPSSGSNWDCVDEVPASDTDYVSTNVSNEIDLYTFSDLSGSIEEVKCVQVQARAVKEGAPTPQNLQLAVRSGGSNYFSGDKAVPATTPTALANIWATNPDTSAAWTPSEVNNAEFGVKAAA
ncbi:MAG: hypothetical protein AB1491_00065 [Thermodesulfobacteriota bacterium]